MNREIEFRAWAMGTMLYAGKDFNAIPVVDQPLATKDGGMATNFVLMQYIGLKNKDGKKIFEGDIIAIPNQYPFYDDGKPNYLATVEFIFGCWQRVLHCVNPEVIGISDGINEILDQGDGASMYEVLGNVFETPELLNGRNQ